MDKLYVAYGSNLNMEQMKRRCPNAVRVASGYLNNWELLYRGSRTGSYATIRRKSGKKVPVGLWRITPSDELHLDAYEGYPTFYHKQNVYVTLQNDTKKKAMVYIMRKSAPIGRPSDAYISTIKQGYEDFMLDKDYLEDSLYVNYIEMQKRG